MIKLANRSRKNRVFFDHLIREIAICLNTGEKSLNREILVPTYLSHQQSGKVNKDYYIQLNRDSGCLFKPLSEVLQESIIDDLDNMLSNAPAEFKGSGSRKLITDYLSLCTDLTDCHYSSMNTMQSIK